MTDDVTDSILNSISHLSTALRMKNDEREGGLKYELKCAIDEVAEHAEGVEVEHK